MIRALRLAAALPLRALLTAMRAMPWGPNGNGMRSEMGRSTVSTRQKVK